MKTRVSITPTTPKKADSALLSELYYHNITIRTYPAGQVKPDGVCTLYSRHRFCPPYAVPTPLATSAKAAISHKNASLAHEHSVWCPVHFSIQNLFSKWDPRCCMLHVLTDRVTQSHIVVLNAHLDSNNASDVILRQIMEGMAVGTALVQQYVLPPSSGDQKSTPSTKQESLLFLACGDFNERRIDAICESMCVHYGMHHIPTARSTSIYGPIDHVFVSNPHCVLGAIQVLPVESDRKHEAPRPNGPLVTRLLTPPYEDDSMASDHYTLVVDFSTQPYRSAQIADESAGVTKTSIPSTKTSTSTRKHDTAPKHEEHVISIQQEPQLLPTSGISAASSRTQPAHRL